MSGVAQSGSTMSQYICASAAWSDGGSRDWIAESRGVMTREIRSKRECMSGVMYLSAESNAAAAPGASCSRCAAMPAAIQPHGSFGYESSRSRALCCASIHRFRSTSSISSWRNARWFCGSFATAAPKYCAAVRYSTCPDQSCADARMSSLSTKYAIERGSLRKLRSFTFLMTAL